MRSYPMKKSLCATLLAAKLSLPLLAQTLPPARPAPPPVEVPVTLSPFVVEEAEDRGYAATSTLAGTWVPHVVAREMASGSRSIAHTWQSQESRMARV